LKLKIDLTPTKHALCGGGLVDIYIFFNELPNDELGTHSILSIQVERIPQLFVLVFLTQYSSHTVYIVPSFDGLYNINTVKVWICTRSHNTRTVTRAMCVLYAYTVKSRDNIFSCRISIKSLVGIIYT